MPESPVVLVGDDALTQEEVRVLLSAGPWPEFTEEEHRTYRAAAAKITAARARCLHLADDEYTSPGAPELSPGHRHLLQAVQAARGRPVHVYPRERELAKDLAVLGLVELAPSGASAVATHVGGRQAA